jgi:hypothetical protein
MEDLDARRTAKDNHGHVTILDSALCHPACVDGNRPG